MGSRVGYTQSELKGSLVKIWARWGVRSKALHDQVCFASSKTTWDKLPVCGLERPFFNFASWLEVSCSSSSSSGLRSGLSWSKRDWLSSPRPSSSNALLSRVGDSGSWVWGQCKVDLLSQVRLPLCALPKKHQAQNLRIQKIKENSNSSQKLHFMAFLERRKLKKLKTQGISKNSS